MAAGQDFLRPVSPGCSRTIPRSSASSSPWSADQAR